MERTKGLTYIAVYRDILQSSVFDDPITFKVWMWCLLKASFKDRDYTINLQTIHILPGQFIAGRKTASKELRISEDQYRARIRTLVATQRITIKTTNKFSIITVINWAYYQVEAKETPSKKPNKPPTNPQQTPTNNNDNKENNLLGETSSPQLEDNKNDMSFKNMRKYKEDGHWEENAIDLDSGEEVIEVDEQKEANEKVTALVEWAEKIRGKKFLDRPTQRKMIHTLRTNKISPTVIKDTFTELLHSDYWKGQERLPDFKTVLSTLKNKK